MAQKKKEFLFDNILPVSDWLERGAPKVLFSEEGKSGLRSQHRTITATCTRYDKPVPMVLNGKPDGDAHLYSYASIARTCAQALKASVSRERWNEQGMWLEGLVVKASGSGTRVEGIIGT